MRKEIADEYDSIRDRISETANCITEWMKLFYGACAALCGAIWIVYQKGSSIDPWIASSLLLSLLYTSVAFATVIFHKFSTHNKYAGYLRAMELEIWTSSSNKDEKLYLWESANITLNKSMIQSILTNSRSTDKNVVHGTTCFSEKEIASMGENYIAKKKKNDGRWPGARKHLCKGIGRGIRMIYSTVIRKVETRSWRYHYQITLGFCLPSFLVFIAFISSIINTWVSLSDSPVKALGLCLMFVISLLPVLLSWVGMSYRLFRLCDDELGDRTIEQYFYCSMASRLIILKSMGIDSQYLKIDPSRDMTGKATKSSHEREKVPADQPPATEGTAVPDSVPGTAASGVVPQGAAQN